MDDQLMPEEVKEAPPALPDGQYAIAELLGHRTVIGRIEEVERFGTKMLQIEPVFEGRLLDPVLHHGSAIYALTPCSADVARQRQPKHRCLLPAAIQALLPPLALSAPQPEDDDDDEDGIPF